MGSSSGAARVALLWRGEPDADPGTTRYWERLRPIVEGLGAAGIEPRVVLFDEDHLAEARRQLTDCSGVLVWVDPDSDGRDRSALNELLVGIAASGTWVSAHPSTIAAIGTKRVLVDTKDLSWGTDCSVCETLDELRELLATLLAEQGSRVLKPVRGNGGRGVWKVAGNGGALYVQDAAIRDDVIERVDLDGFTARFEPLFAGGGSVVEQALVATAREGMVRAYVSIDRVVGFARQYPSVERAPTGTPHDDPVFAMASHKTMYPAGEPTLGSLRVELEEAWIPELRQRFDLSPLALPAIWDLDFLRRPGSDGYVLCEVNVSCVSPFPPEAVPAIVRCAVQRSLGGEV